MGSLILTAGAGLAIYSGGLSIKALVAGSSQTSIAASTIYGIKGSLDAISAGQAIVGTYNLLSTLDEHSNGDEPNVNILLDAGYLYTPVFMGTFAGTAFQIVFEELRK
jgi:hypothetical protein